MRLGASGVFLAPRGLHRASMEFRDLAENLLGVLSCYLAVIIKGDAQIIKPCKCGLNFAFEQVRYFLVEDLRGRRIAHIVALGVVLSGIHMGGANAVLLDPQTIDVILESQPSREEWRQAEGVVITRYS